jgi:hypothetical protein
VIAAILYEDPQAFELHQEVVRTGRMLKKLEADPNATLDARLEAASRYANALAVMHEKCALEAA